MADFQFLYPNWFYASIPALILCGWLYSKPQRTSLIASHLTQQLGLDKRQSHRSIVSIISTAWLIAIIALASPSFQKQEVPSFGVNNARVIVMDMTLSMYATDIAPNRLAQARYKVMDLLPALKEGSTGLIAYSGDGYMISPLTSDTNTLASLIPNLSPDIMPVRGSNAAAGVKKAISMLTQAGHQQGDIILVADDISTKETRDIQDLLNGTNWQLSVMSVGTPQGAPIRLPNGDMFTSNGTTVVAKTNVKGLQALAKAGNGVYTPLRADDRDIQTLTAALDHVELKTTKENKGSPELEVHINNGFWLLPILLLLALGAFRRGGIFCLAAILSFPLLQPHDAYAAAAEPTKMEPGFNLNSAFKTRDQQGYEAYQAKAYNNAAALFVDKKWKGIAQYQAGDFQGAIQSFTGLNDVQSRYNLASSQAQANLLNEAKAGYEAILESNPDFTDAKKDLDIVEKALQQQQKQKQKQKQDKSKEQQSKDNQSKDQQSQDKQSQNNQGNQSNKNDSSPDSQENQSQQEQGQQNQTKKNQSDQKKPNQQQSQQNPKQNQSGNSQQNQQENGKNSDQADNKSTSDNSNNSDNNSDKNQKQQKQKAQQAAQANQSDQDKLQEQKKQQAMKAQQDPNANPQAGNTVAVDTQLKKLEQIPDNAKRLLQAQMALEAQQNPEPQTNSQQW
ncbi:VWA domain-containing protein [Vibrio casei]|uniref:VWA domain-containing protein n=1 Tax=Vibrio casei TaxID=673372 RepID=UPI000B5C7DB2|nr:VWA domain-containing protein [Vibrio casei]